MAPPNHLASNGSLSIKYGERVCNPLHPPSLPGADPTRGGGFHLSRRSPAHAEQLDRIVLPLNPPGDFSPPVPEGGG